MATSACGYFGLAVPSGWGYALALRIFVAGQAFIEVFSYHRHKRAIAELRGNHG